MNDTIDLTRTWVRRCLLAAIAVALSIHASEPRTQAQDAGQAGPPPARYLRLTSPVNDVLKGRVRNIGIELQNEALQRDREAVLILEIAPGTSEFGTVLDIAQFLTSPAVSRVRTIAWIPLPDDGKPIDHHHAILALACREIVMHPEAQLGNIGRGEPLPGAQRDFVLELAEKRINPKVSPALVRGMLDPAQAVLKAEVTPAGAAAPVQRVLTQDEVAELRMTKAEIGEVRTIKEAGSVGLFTGREARGHDVLVTQTADSRAELADRYGLPAGALREDAVAGEDRKVRLIRVEGMIEPVLESFIERQIDRAVADGATVIVFEITSPGGYIVTSEQLATTIADLESKNIRTVAYIPKQAISGAAIVALGCDEIYLRRDAQIGDAIPLEGAPGGQLHHAPEKWLSKIRTTLNSLAQRKNRPIAIAEAMADMKLEVFEVTHAKTGRTWYMSEDEIERSGGEWVRGPRVPESRPGVALNVAGQRAHELKLAEPPVADFDELKQRIGVPADVTLLPVERTWIDGLIFQLNTNEAMFFLVFLGIVLIYVELHMMTGLLGILSVLCFALFFWSRVMGGTAGYLELILFLIGLGCLAMEIFVIPGFGVFGISGGLLVIASIVMAGQTFGNLEPDRDFSTLSRTMGTLGASVLSVIVVAVFASRFLPHMPVFNRMVLQPPGSDAYADGPKLRPELTGEGSFRQSLVGKTGTAVSPLRPAGKAQIGENYVDVVSDGPFIPQGTPVAVVAVRGNLVVVREA
ncbi:MAG: NfeD family protein [Planctomycetaceae bacterium]